MFKGVPMREVVRTGKKNKLDLRYVGPFKILERIGPLAYRLALRPELEKLHNVFYIYQLRKYCTRRKKEIKGCSL